MIPKHILELYRQGKIKPGDALHWQYFESKNTPFDLSRQDRIDRGDWTEEQYRPRHELATALASDSQFSSQYSGGHPFDIEIAARNIDQISKAGSQAQAAITSKNSQQSTDPQYTPGREPNAIRDGDKEFSMKAGELFRGGGVERVVRMYDFEIEDAGLTYDVDSDLIRALIYEEQTHRQPFESEMERDGTGSTVGLGQVTENLHGYSREELLDPTINIDAIGKHLAFLSNQSLIDPNDEITSLATKYNCGSCTQLTAYGRRVRSHYDDIFSGISPKGRSPGHGGGGGGGW